MKITKGKIILIAVVLYFSAFAIININKEKEINKEVLNKVTYVTDGIVRKENEGKLVLVSGKIKYDSLVTFSELDNFKTIKIKRKVEDYVKTYDEDTNEIEYEWQERKEPLENATEYLKQITSEERIVNIKIGDYNLDEKGLSMIPTDKYYSNQENIENLTTTGIFYARDPWEEELQEGDIKLTYKYYDINKKPFMSILAVQKGNSFIPYKIDKKNEVYQLFTKKVDTKAKLEKELKLNVKKTKKGKTLFILMILGIGIFFIVDSKKTN